MSPSTTANFKDKVLSFVPHLRNRHIFLSLATIAIGYFAYTRILPYVAFENAFLVALAEGKKAIPLPQPYAYYGKQPFESFLYWNGLAFLLPGVLVYYIHAGPIKGSKSLLCRPLRLAKRLEQSWWNAAAFGVAAIPTAFLMPSWNTMLPAIIVLGVCFMLGGSSVWFWLSAFVGRFVFRKTRSKQTVAEAFTTNLAPMLIYGIGAGALVSAFLDIYGSRHFLVTLALVAGGYHLLKRYSGSKGAAALIVVGAWILYREFGIAEAFAHDGGATENGGPENWPRSGEGRQLIDDTRENMESVRDSSLAGAVAGDLAGRSDGAGNEEEDEERENVTNALDRTLFGETMDLSSDATGPRPASPDGDVPADGDNAASPDGEATLDGESEPVRDDEPPPVDPEDPERPRVEGFRDMPLGEDPPSGDTDR